MSSFDEFIKGLRALDKRLREDQTPLEKAADFMIRNFPPEPQSHHDSGNKNRWDSERQRRWYYWKVGLGQLENPYVRSHKLINSIVKSKPKRIKGGSSITVFSNYDNAVFIIGDAGVHGETAAVHEGRWWEFDKEVARMEKDVLDVFENDLLDNLASFW